MISSGVKYGYAGNSPHLLIFGLIQSSGFFFPTLPALKYQVTVAVFNNFSIFGLGGKILEPKSRHIALKT